MQDAVQNKQHSKRERGVARPCPLSRPRAVFSFLHKRHGKEIAGHPSVLSLRPRRGPLALKVIDGKLTNRHHRYWPKRVYTHDPPPGIDVEIARRFRDLPCESEQIEISRHVRLHKKEDPPPVPTQAEMEAHLVRHERQLCTCFRDKPARIVIDPPAPPRKRSRKKQTRRSGPPRVARPAFAR